MAIQHCAASRAYSNTKPAKHGPTGFFPRRSSKITNSADGPIARKRCLVPAYIAAGASGLQKRGAYYGPIPLWRGARDLSGDAKVAPYVLSEARSGEAAFWGGKRAVGKWRQMGLGRLSADPAPNSEPVPHTKRTDSRCSLREHYSRRPFTNPCVNQRHVTSISRSTSAGGEFVI